MNVKKKPVRILLVVVFLSSLSAAWLYAQDWPMYGHDLSNTGYSSSSGPSVGYTLWDYTTGGSVLSSPAVANGKVYIGSNDHKVYFLDANTGDLIGARTIGGVVYSSPAVANGKVYIGSGNGKVYCLNADTGDWMWEYTTGGYLSSPAVADGKVYIGSDDNKVYCLGNNLDERVSLLESSLTTATDRIDTLEAENAALRSDLDTLNARMSETELKFIELPGVRLNIYGQGEYSIPDDETTNVWHGFRSNPWSEYTEEQKTEFLSTAQWRLSVDGEEVPLDHILRYTEENDRMWSLYYRVFPPGYFKVGSHRLVGEWHSMEDGVWDSDVREARLRIK